MVYFGPFYLQTFARGSLLSDNICVIRVRHRNLPPLNINQITLIIVDNDDVSLEIVKQLVQNLITITQNTEQKNKLTEYLSTSNFVNTTSYEELRKYKGKPAPQQSLGDLYPEVYKIWHTKFNYPITPKDAHPASHEIFWWKCQICKHEWRRQIASQCSRKVNGKPINILRCPNCTKSQPTPQYNLAKMYPELLDEISSEDNIDFKPNLVSPFSGEKIIWKCKICAYKWTAPIRSRSGRKTGCPRCKGKIITHENSLEGRYPDVIFVWDYEKNKIEPNKISAHTHAKYFFKCSCGKSFECRPNKFILGQRRCKQCTRKNLFNSEEF